KAFIKMKRPHNLRIQRLPTRKESLADDELREFHVWWLDINERHVRAFEKCLNAAKSEREIQEFLEQNPMLLVQHLGGGHGRWAIPQQRLGSSHVTDFIIGHAHSDGHDWVAVVLESPSAALYSKNGDPSKHLNHAIRQVLD